MSISSDLAKEWAEKEASSEAEAFEFAIKSTAIKKMDFDIDDKYEQAYRQGWHDGFKCCNDKMASKFLNENAELRDTIKIQSEQIHKLRECIARNHEDFYE